MDPQNHSTPGLNRRQFLILAATAVIAARQAELSVKVTVNGASTVALPAAVRVGGVVPVVVKLNSGEDKVVPTPVIAYALK